jgi:hypothetical protein
MAVKSSFEPKNARVTFDKKYYSNDIPRKRITGTQALVEFLNTTSPEEFQKRLPMKRSSALFFRRGSNNNKASKVVARNSAATASTIHRKNYIEIIVNPFTFNKSKDTTTSTATPLSSSATRGGGKNNHIAILGSQLNHTLSKSSNIYSIHDSATVNKPFLPMRKGNGMTNVLTSAIINKEIPKSEGKSKSAMTTRRQIPSLSMSPAIQQDDQYINSILSTPRSSFSNEEEDDLIEGGLKQRLNHYQSLLQEKPSDTISKRLAHEHMVALQVASFMMIEEQQTEKVTCRKKKKNSCRHIQVQTMPYPNDNNAVTNQLQEVEKDDYYSSNNESINELKQRLERAEKELKEEKLISSRLQAALEETCDQYEVLSGLAYKKLREVWEEKKRWEYACIETKERCWHDHQQQILGHHANDSSDSFLNADGTAMNFMIDEDIEINTTVGEEEGEEKEDLI